MLARIRCYQLLSGGSTFTEWSKSSAGGENLLSGGTVKPCVSLRELVTHTIHKLAPDKKAVKYLKTLGDVEEYLDEGRPTRRGRILYICREIEMGNFSKFVNADAKSTLAFIDLLQEGTHSLEMPYSAPQLTALLSRAEGLLSFLIDVSNV